ncbi:hypothetical protein [Pedobacter sp. UBA5917]|jgi:hypothetical protein|uniref:hypothetical protein n=1 Tax=Pedobacter sp. UBA5917 TaxID=1947061 RepID=UPI0025E486A0|nr:hypothetical protein [Pedobacter sp. UBA5917]
MKNLKQFYSLIILFSLFTLSCKQITQSVDETFHPNDSLVKQYNKENHSGTNGEYTGTAKTSTITSVQRHQEKIIVINGDTINTPEMELKAKEMFHDIDLLKQQKSPETAKEIQKRVNQFLKEMKLPQGGLKNIDTEKPVIKAKKGLLSIPDLALAEEQLKRLPQYRNKEIMVYQSVHFYDNGSINLMLQHPVNPKYVDAYEYRDGAWSAPKPVLARDIERRTFPLSGMHFEDARKVLKIYNEKAVQIEGAKPTTSVYISIWDENMRWFPAGINGTRERFDIQFNRDGSLKSFRQE